MLPAFLESTSRTDSYYRYSSHYLYLAFANTYNRTFTAIPHNLSSSENYAEEQGAAFMVQCVKNLLERPDDDKSYEVAIPPVHELKDSIEAYVEELQEYLSENLGKECLVWFHIDEHRKICDATPDSPGGAAFSRGALEVLIMLGPAFVVVTCTVLPDFPAIGSSGTCRMPIALPPLDVNQVISGSVDELLVHSGNLEEKDIPLYPILKTRLGLLLNEKRLMGILHGLGRDEEAKKLFNDLQSTIQKREQIKVLQDYIARYEVELPLTLERDPDAARIIRGVTDMDNTYYIDIKRFSDAIVLPNGLISLSVMKLLQVEDSNLSVYTVGRDLFRKYLYSPLDEPDLFSSSLLEAAYYWALSCRCSDLGGGIKFRYDTLFFRCTDLLPGRLFPGTNSSIYDLSILKQNVMYYADERGSSPVHPLAKVFFVTSYDQSTFDELVLVDISGRSREAAEERANNLATWIQQEKDNISDLRLLGVVLAPNAEGSSKKYNGVTLLCGNDTIRLLGGLGQIHRWIV